MNNSSSPQPRTVAVQMTINDPKNGSATYSVVPVACPSDCVRMFELRKRTKDGAIEATYRCYLQPSGKVGCSCPGFMYRQHCKHLDAMRRFYMIDAEAYLACTGAELQLKIELEKAEQARTAACKLEAEYKQKLAALEASMQAKPIKQRKPSKPRQRKTKAA